jgi:formate--tetrahydrofolate ligase
LHFTGDFHAIGAAHNLLSAVIDNHLHHQGELNLDGRRITWPRVLDVNDRALRNVITGLGGRAHGEPRQAAVDITAASELMAMLCLAEDAEDLRKRLDRALVAIDRDKEPVRAGQLGITGSMLALLRDALHPNLVQTLEGTPAFVHGGPFANIAHGCNSVMATKMALANADLVVTEAGFGFDLGAEKFFDIKCRSAGLDPALVVLVASVRALKLHGGANAKNLAEPDVKAVERGLCNLDKHLESVGHFGKSAVVAINRMASDTDDEIGVIRKHLDGKGVPFALAEHFAKGAAGAEELAKLVMTSLEKPSEKFTPMYELSDSVEEKVRKVATRIYGARDVVLSAQAQREVAEIAKLGLSDLPICIAKTQSSLSDDPKRLGRPEDFEVTVRSVLANAGAGFLVVLTGNILRMPGLPKKPQAENIDLQNGEIVGLR